MQAYIGEGLKLLDLLQHPAHTLEMSIINVDVTLGRASCKYVLQAAFTVLCLDIYDSEAISLVT